MIVKATCALHSSYFLLCFSFLVALDGLGKRNEGKAALKSSGIGCRECSGAPAKTTQRSERRPQWQTITRPQKKKKALLSNTVQVLTSRERTFHDKEKNKWKKRKSTRGSKRIPLDILTTATHTETRLGLPHLRKLGNHSRKSRHEEARLPEQHNARLLSSVHHAVRSA